MTSEYPIRHECIDCGAEVLQHDSEVPPWAMFGPGWLCHDCKAKRDAAYFANADRARRQQDAEIARSEANDRWEEGG